MPPIILTLLQVLFLLLLYLFVARAVRAVLRDIRTTSPAPRAAGVGGPARAAPAAAGRPRRKRGGIPSELVVHTPEGRPQVVRLDSEEVRFGRTESCTVQLEDTYVSELHARVYQADEGWVVADMGSTNGTFLNQQKVTRPAVIEPGDQLGIGRTVVEVRK